MREILPTQFDEDRPLRVYGRLLAKICRAVNAMKASFGFGFRVVESSGGTHVEIDPDQIRDSQICLMRLVSIADEVDGSYPETIIGAPVNNPTDLRVVSIATPELKAALLAANANDPAYDNAYEEYIDNVWRNNGATNFVAFRLEAPTNNFLLDEYNNPVDVYWLAEAARVYDVAINSLAGDPWIDVSYGSIDTGQTTPDGQTIYAPVGRVQHREITDYDTADTGSTNEILSRVGIAGSTITVTPVTLLQDDAGHIHTFTDGSSSNINVGAGGTDELVASQSGQTAGYLSDVLVSADNWAEVTLNGATVDLTHADPQAQDYTVTYTGDSWLTPSGGPLSYDAKGHERTGANVTIDYNHADAQASIVSTNPVSGWTAPSSTQLAIGYNTIPTDNKGHVNTGDIAGSTWALNVTGDSWVVVTLSAAAGAGTIGFVHGIPQSPISSFTIAESSPYLTLTGTTTLEFDQKGHYTDGPTEQVTIGLTTTTETVYQYRINGTDLEERSATITVLATTGYGAWAPIHNGSECSGS